MTPFHYATEYVEMLRATQATLTAFGEIEAAQAIELFLNTPTAVVEVVANN